MKHYACHSKPREDGYWGRAMCHEGNSDYPPEYGMEWIPDTMTKECNYRKTTPDERCKGCTCP